MEFSYEGIAGPPPHEDRQSWYENLKLWRTEQHLRMGYSAEEYNRPELAWLRSDFVQAQMMVEDRYFYDPLSRQYTVDRYLDDLESRYGGLDSVLVWPTYPNIGIDERNQHDMLRAMPGGIDGVRMMVGDFHRRGVRVFFPVMPWDVGTRPTDQTYWQLLARDLAYVEADGLNGDTLSNVPRAFLEAAHQLQYFPATQPEVGVAADEALAWNLASWGYWWPYPFEPVISRAKFIEPRHKVHVTNRWRRDRTDDLQNAFFNGVGYNSWENIWSIWNGLTPRDSEAVRRVALVSRFFADLLTSQQWQPYYPTMQRGIFASCFGLGEGSRRLWTIINRNSYPVSGPQLSLSGGEGWRYFDVWKGVELTPLGVSDGEGQGQEEVYFSFEIEGRGYGAFLAVGPGAFDDKLADFLGRMSQLSHTPLSLFSSEWHFLPQQLVQIEKTAPASPDNPPPDMVLIKGGNYLFEVKGIEIEGEDAEGVDVQYPWESSPRRHHSHLLTLSDYYIDRYPVTNRQYKEFVEVSGYYPADDYNYLRDWQNGTYQAGWEDKPVTWVSLEDAREYAKWAEKRLPHEWEWQYAAQDKTGQLYPWGNEPSSETLPPLDRGRERRAPSDVRAFEGGMSPFGVVDLVGNVWQWTDEYLDEHTRSAIVRGGSYYRPGGSHWYFPNTYKLNEHGKYLLMSPGRDRAGTIGFRCVKDTGNDR